MNKKLLLFDIDGTLLSTHGIPRIAMGNVLKDRYKQFKYDDYYNFSGRTDWQIVEHLLAFDNRDEKESVVHQILDDFAVELAKQLANGKQPLVYPGVQSLLEFLAAKEEIYLGLVTGNISKGARIKLNAAELNHYFPIGGFGDDAKDRDALPPIALERAKEHFGIEPQNEDIWIIGDSIYDIQCARVNGLRTLAVSTGLTDHEVLAAENPEYLVPDFTDTEQTIKILLS